MSKNFEQISIFILLYLIGGFSYILLEMIWRGHSPWSMFLAGGLCFTLLTFLNHYMVNQQKKRSPALFSVSSRVKKFFVQQIFWLGRCLCGGLLITSIEFFTGAIVNLWLGWHVWDYSSHHFQFLGQISLLYFILWTFLSAPVFWLGTCLQKKLSLILHFFFRISLTPRLIHEKMPPKIS